MDSARREGFHTEVTPMAIEAVNSMMSVQAQTSVPKTQTTRTESTQTAPEQTAQAAQRVDQTTTVVEKTQNNGQTNADDQNQEQSGQPSNSQLKQAVEKMNKQNMMNSEAVFGIHDGTNRVTIKIVDKDTKEVIKELPPEKTLDMIAKVWELAGIMVDERR